MAWRPSRRRRPAGGLETVESEVKEAAASGATDAQADGLRGADSSEVATAHGAEDRVGHSRRAAAAGVSTGAEVEAAVGDGSEDPWMATHSDPWSRDHRWQSSGCRRESWETNNDQWQWADWSQSWSSWNSWDAWGSHRPTWLDWQWGARGQPWWAAGAHWDHGHAGQPVAASRVRDHDHAARERSGVCQVPGPFGEEPQGDVGLHGEGGRPGPEVSWFNDAKLDESLEYNPAAWPPGTWSLHKMNEGDNDEEPNPPPNALTPTPVKSTSRTSTSTTPSSRKIPSTYPPSFSASPSESYLEWKRSVQCWIAGEGGQLPEDVMGPRCLSVLKGRALVIVRHLRIEDVSQVGGLELVFKALESSPMVKELDGQRGEKAQREFLRCRRQAGESMESFIMRVQAQRAVMEEEDSTFAVGDRFLVGYIMDNAELTLKDRVMVLAAAQNQMSSEAIFPALRRMGPFLQGTVPIGKGVLDAPLLPELQPDLSQGSSKTHAADGGGGKEHRRPWQPFKAHVVEEASGYSGPDDDEFEELSAGWHIPEELESATHAAMAAFSASQAKLRALKQARGYFQKTEPAVQPDRRDRLKKLMQENPCRGCGGYGHWSKDPECPKNAKSSSASLVTTPAMSSSTSPEQPQQQSEHAAMSAVSEQMMRDQHQSSARVYMAGVVGGEEGQGTIPSSSSTPEEFVTLVNANAAGDLLASRMVVDLGCLRTVAGVQWVVQEVSRCRAHGRFVAVKKTLDYFRFGDGERRPSHYRVFMEVGIVNHVGLLAINAVEYPCPPLLSKGVCSALGLHLDCGSGRFDLAKLGVQSQHFTTSSEGHFLLSIDCFHPSWPSWQTLLQAGHVPKIQHEEIQCFELRQGVPVGRGARRARAHSSPLERSSVSDPRSGPSRGSATCPSLCAHGSASAPGRGFSCAAPDHPTHGHRGTGLGLRDRSVRGGLSASEVVEGDAAGCIHGGGGTSQQEGRQEIQCPHEGGQGDRTEHDQGEGEHQNHLQEGTAHGHHRPQCRVSNAGDDLECRPGPEHELDHPWPPSSPQVEANGVDAEGSSGCHSGGAPVSASPALASNDVCSRGGGAVGAFGRCDADAAGASRTAADEVTGGSEPKPDTVRPTCRPWNRGQVQRLRHCLKQTKQAISHLSLVAKCSDQATWKVLEIFGGSANLSLIARSTGKWVALEPVDLMYGSDLLSPKEQRVVLDQLHEWEPDLVCLEPPCGPWSSLQAINPKETVELKRALHMPFWYFSAKVWKVQHNSGRLVLLEQPLKSAALHLECMRSRASVHRAVVDQCQFELRDPQSGKRYRKRTALDVNSEVFASALMVGGLCSHASHEHETIEGQVLLDGKWVNRSLVAGMWTPCFARHILSCAALALQHATCWQQRVQGVCSFVADFEEGLDCAECLVFLTTSPRALVCSSEGCYEVGESWCERCKKGWCNQCMGHHGCDVRDEVFKHEEPWGETMWTWQEANAADEWAALGATSEELHTDLAIQQAFRQLQREEDERKGDFSGMGSRYGYCKFVGPSLRVNKSVRNQVAKLHANLGHPSNDRLARMLKLQGARTEVVQAARDLRCEVCSRIHPPLSAPKSSAKAPERFNEHCSMDSFFILDADNQRWSVTHVVDGFCSLQYAILSKNPSSQTSCSVLFDRWVMVHGPMKKLSVDGGPEFRGRFPCLCQLYGIELNVLPTSAKWKAGLAERHGAILKLILLKMVHELVLNKETSLSYALAMAVQAKNRLSRRCGKSPIQVVQGRDQVIPSSLVEQIDRAEVQFATNSQLLEVEEHQTMERMRQEAASAFHWLDSHERLRAALNARSKPPHLKADSLPPGAIVYFYKQSGQNRRLQDFAVGFQGPAVVACADGPDRVWLRFKGSVVRVAIENVRLATPEEELGPSFIMDALTDLEKELTGNRRAPGYDDEEDVGNSEAGVPGSGDLPSGVPSETQFLSGTTGIDRKGEVQTAGPSTSEPSAPLVTPEMVELVKESADRARALDGLPRKFKPRPSPYPVSVPEKIAFFEKGGQDDWKSILHDIDERQPLKSGLQRLAAEKDLQELDAAIDWGLNESARQRDNGGEPMTKAPRVDGGDPPIEPGVSALAPMVAEAKMALEAWALSSASSDVEKQRMSEMMEEFDRQQMELERGHRAGPEPGARGEIYLKDMTPTEVRLTIPALVKALDIHFQYEAVEPVPLDTPIAKESTLQSRFVIVNKKWLQRLFGPKGRLCVGGHRDPEAGEYPTSSPTAQLLAHHLLLIIMVGKRWKGYGGDITAAFLQGEPLPRDKPLYIWLPKKMPSEVNQYLEGKLQGFRTDLVKVVKGVFGLNESPRLWYLGLRRHLKELGFRELTLAPCVFVLHVKGVLQAMATVHVDDCLTAGSPDVEQVWTELKGRLTFGSWTPMVDGIKFLGRHMKQNEETFEVVSDMDEYCSDLEEIPFDPQVADNKPLLPDQVASLRSCVGKLSWAVRQGRPDLLFLVSWLQQSFKEPTTKLLRVANSVVRALKKPQSLSFVHLGCPLEDILFVVSSDGAYGTMPDGKSQQGWIIGVANPTIKHGGARMNLVEWQSTACKRVVRSSMAIEACAASLAFEHGEYVRALFGEIMCPDFEVNRWGHFIRLWELILVLDAKTAFDTLQTESLPQDRRTALDLLAIKESLLDQSNRALCRWVPGPQQISDSLTKEKGNKILSDFLSTNEWSHREDTAWQEQRSRQRATQKEYKVRMKAQRAAGGKGVPG